MTPVMHDGPRIRGRQRKYHKTDAFAPPLDPFKEYWSGFLFADGCLSCRGRSEVTA